MLPKTQYEINGEWSTAQFSFDLVQTIAEETNSKLSNIGKSFRGNDMPSLEMGSGENLLYVTGGVHRNENAAHEAVLMMMRDVAYNVGGKYSTYLKNHKIIFVPTMQPDRENTRNSSQGVNINRDAYVLETPEMANFIKEIVRTKPDIHVDFHERWGSSSNIQRIEFIDAMSLDPNADVEVRNANLSFESGVRNQLEKRGYDTFQYPQTIIGPGMTVAISGLLGSVSMTPETYIEGTTNEHRVNALRETFEAVLKWHTENKNLIQRYKDSYSNNTIKPRDRFILLNGNNQYYAGATNLGIIAPEGYILDDINEFEKWIDTFGIEVTDDNFISIKQNSGRVIPHLLDPESDMKVAKATRVEPVGPVKRTDGRYTKVLMDEWREVFIKGFYA